MPAGDNTGPTGQGPRTGRGAGFCSGYDMPGYENPMPRRGFWQFGGWFGRRGGQGQGYCRREYLFGFPASSGFTGLEPGRLVDIQS